jgi:photosystem II stability/assembly factor-like uncharacterized protein
MALIFSTINVLPAFAALGDDWEGNASGLRESTSLWRGSEISSDGHIQGFFDDLDLYISTDFGASWTKKFTVPYTFRVLTDLEISQDGSTIVALTNGLFTALTPIFYVSTDFGNTWIEKTGPADIGNGFTQFALSADGLKLVTISNQTDASGRVFYSLNSGNTWNESLSRPAGGNLSGQWRSIDISPDGTKIVVSGGQTGIKISQDLGETWSFVAGADENVIWPKVSFVNNDGSWIMAGTAFWDSELGLIKLFVENEGNFFDYLCFLDPETPCDENGYGRPVIWSNFAVASDGSKSFGIGNANGSPESINSVYRSGDSGETFSNTNLPEGRWTSISTDAAGTYLVATAWNKQIYVSNDSGITWTAKSTGQEPDTYNWNDVESSSSGQYIYAIRNEEKLFKSSDYGVTWSDTNAPEFNVQSNKSLSVSADGSKIFYSKGITDEMTYVNCFIEQTLQGSDCSLKVFISNDYGQNWTSASVEGEVAPFAISISSDGQTLALSSLSLDLTTEDGANYGILVSRDSGLTWVKKKTMPFIGSLGSVSISGDGQKMIATLDDGLIFFASTDFGNTWIEKSLTEEISDFKSEVSNISISNDGSKVYALTNTGLYLSTNFGNEWVLTGALDAAGCNDFKLSPDGSKIVLGCDDTVQYSEDSGQTFRTINSSQGFNRQAVAASQDFSTVAFASSEDVYVSHTDAFVPNPTTPAAPSGNNDSRPAASTPTPTAKPKVEEVKEKIKEIKEDVEEKEVMKPGTIAAAEPLIMRLIEDLPVILKPQIVNIFTEEPVANQVLDIKKALDFLKEIVDKVVVDLPSLVRVGGEIQASRLVVVDNTTLQLVTADGGVLSVQANDGENPIPVDKNGKVQMVRSNGVETKGVGLSPNSEFSVYLFSDPTLLGVGKADAQGNFNASFLVDKDFPLGNHTLQINGMLANGKTSSISMPVSVVESVEMASTQAMVKTVAEVKTTNTNFYLVFLLIMLALIGSIIVFKGPRFIYDQFKQRIE